MPELKTTKEIEKHAAKIYTYANFYKFQDEFWAACMDCEIENKHEVQEGVLIYVVDNSRNRNKTRQVMYDPSNHVAHCSCKMLELTSKIHTSHGSAAKMPSQNDLDERLALLLVHPREMKRSSRALKTNTMVGLPGHHQGKRRRRFENLGSRSDIRMSLLNDSRANNERELRDERERGGRERKSV